MCVSEGLEALWHDYANGSKQRRRLLESRYGRSVLQGTLEDCLSEDWIVSNSKHCPHCFCKIEVFSYSLKSTHIHELTNTDSHVFTDTSL